MKQNNTTSLAKPISILPCLSRVLVVDDERINREMLSRMLQRNGYAAISVGSGQDALTQLDSEPFDLVLLDVVMPEMDGFECLQRIRENYSVIELPVIMVTAEQERDRVIQAFRAGANDYVTKPIDRDITLARIATHTKLRASLAALKDSEERYSLAVSGSNDGIWDWNVAQNEVHYSPRWKAMLGYQEGDIGTSLDEWLNRIHCDDCDRFRDTFMGPASGDKANLRCEIRMIHRDGTFRWMFCRGVSVRDADGAVCRMAGSLSDITEGKVGDPLTGLPNRLLFMDRLEHAIGRFERNSQFQFSVLFLDLDKFKLINDSMGHQAGDQLLITIAHRLGNCLRQTDSVFRAEPTFTLARHAGDEFTILLEDLQCVQDVERVAERLLAAISLPVKIERQEITPAASIGWTMCNVNSLTPIDLLREADTAMYYAKSAGRNRAKQYDTSMQHSATLRLELEQQLRLGLANNEFLLHFQPILRLPAEKIIGFESLVRWQHPQRGLVYPGDFISTAEEVGLIIPLGWKITEMACAQAAVWEAQFPHIEAMMTINFSPKQFGQKDFLDTFRDVVKRTGVSSQRLCIEVTETILMEKQDLICPLLQSMRDMGAKIAVDDFGTGYSSLAYLHRFPIDILKIDRSFVKSIFESPENLQIVRTIIDLGRSLKLRVVAEGVETEAQRDRLIELGCDHAQGYLWAPAMPATLATSKLQVLGAMPITTPLLAPQPIAVF